MNILIKKPGIMLIEQYGNKYIRYSSGGVTECILQRKITEDEFDRILNSEIQMEDVVNYYDNTYKSSDDELRYMLLQDFFKAETKYTTEKIEEIIEKLKNDGSIFFEFYDFVLYEKFTEEPTSIAVDKYIEEKL